MNSKPYLLVSGVVFSLVALLHLIRVLNGWPMELGDYAIPAWVSICGTIGPGILAVWAFRLTSASK
jgi:hypothetical protein